MPGGSGANVPGRGGGAGGVVLDERGLPSGYRLREQWEVSPRRVKAMLDAGEPVVLIDCRTPREHELGRIEGGILVPLQEAGSRMADLQGYADDTVVVYCHHGSRSLRMVQMLQRAGFARARSMAGGIDLWSLDIDRSVPRY